jgi:chaperone modulatory protein CbpM
MADKIISGTVLDEQVTLSVIEICQACKCREEWLLELVDHGVVEPGGKTRDEWRFSVESISRVNTARRLRRDLGVNIEGIALTLDLLDEVNRLRSRIERLASKID